MSVNSRLLIKQIEARPALWNRDDRDYCNKQIVSRQWAEIALVHGAQESKVKSKWKALRDTFRQVLKKNPEQSSWNYYADMQFLRGQLKMLPAPANKSGLEEDDDDDDESTFVKREPAEDGIPEEPSDGRDEQGYASQEDDASQGCDADPDDDYHFLMSLLPEMRKLAPRQKLLLRIKMMELFYKEAYPQEL